MPFREIVLNNFWWKLAALFLAVGAYYAIKSRSVESGNSRDSSINLGSSYSTRELIAHPITVTKPASDTREFKVSPSDVDITLGGELERLKTMDGREVRATVDLAAIQGTTSSAPILVYVPEGRGIRLLRMNPETVQVELLKP